VEKILNHTDSITFTIDRNCSFVLFEEPRGQQWRPDGSGWSITFLLHIIPVSLNESAHRQIDFRSRHTTRGRDMFSEFALSYDDRTADRNVEASTANARSSIVRCIVDTELVITKALDNELPTQTNALLLIATQWQGFQIRK